MHYSVWIFQTYVWQKHVGGYRIIKLHSYTVVRLLVFLKKYTSINA